MSGTNDAGKASYTGWDHVPTRVGRAIITALSAAHPDTQRRSLRESVCGAGSLGYVSPKISARVIQEKNFTQSSDCG